MKLVAISLGSNLGGRLENLRAARERLRALAAPDGPFLVAPVYRTAPVDCPPGSPEFFNSVVAFGFGGTPRELLAATQAIESALGRAPAEERAPNSPRPVDLDILFFGDETIETDDLVIPHPRMFGRRFVLQPLADILPDRVLPGCEETVSGVLAELGDSGEEVVQQEW